MRLHEPGELGEQAGVVGRAEFQEVFDQFVEAFSERENVQRLVQGAADYPGLLAELARLMEPHAA